MLPTTCPHLEDVCIFANNTIHTAPVMIMKMTRECSCRNSWTDFGTNTDRLTLLLSTEPTSCKYLVARIMTSIPVQSAMALPKNAPQCFSGSAQRYSKVQSSRMQLVTMLSPCRCQKVLFLPLIYSELDTPAAPRDVRLAA